MIQRFPSRFAAAALALLTSLGGCAHAAPHAIPRTLHGTTVRGAFVPPTSYEAYVRGELLLAQGRPREAAAQFELAATAPDEDPYLLSRLAVAELASGDADGAKRTLDHAAQLDGCSEAVWLARGAVAEHRRDVQAARSAYQHASACAPRSALGELALAQLLERQGDKSAAIDLFVGSAQRPYAARLEHTLERSLRDADAATLAHAFASLGANRAPDSDAAQQAIRLALDRDLPRLAWRIAEGQPASIPPALEAELLSALDARERLTALLARHAADDLGGSANTALLALRAGAYERAELEATSALVKAPSDQMRAVRARATLALQQRARALSDIAQISEPALRRALLLEALAGTGAPALANELAVRAVETK